MRGSDPDAALYYLARMLDAGEDPLFIVAAGGAHGGRGYWACRPPSAHGRVAAKDAYDFLGSPEGELAIANAVIYAATAPKSNAAYAAFKGAARLAKDHGSLMPPKIILNAPTKLMKNEGYGANYAYDHDEPEGFSGQNYWPEALERQTLYRPVDRGFERDLRARLDLLGQAQETKERSFLTRPDPRFRAMGYSVWSPTADAGIER